MTVPIVVEPEAEEELAAATDGYERQGEGLGAALLAEVSDAFAELRRGASSASSLPNIGLPCPAWRLLLQRFPYSIVFVRKEGTIFVVAVAHHRREPSYWKERIERR